MAKVKTGASAGKLAEGSHCLGIWRFYLEADEDEEKDDLGDDDVVDNDIFIMMTCLPVCVSRKMITFSIGESVTFYPHFFYKMLMRRAEI